MARRCRMPAIMAVVESDLLDELCSSAEDAARARGHELGPWSAPPEEGSVARAARCLQCGRGAYVRSEPPIVGAAGPALSERCDGVDEAAAG
jgi:hypothetical protein